VSPYDPGPALPAAPQPARSAADEWARQEAILAAEIAASGDREPPDDAADERPGWLDADDLPPAGEADPIAVEPFPCGLVAHGPEGPGGTGFRSGSVLDGLAPGPVLAGALQDACAAGLSGLSDDELAGVMLAWRRCESQAVAGLLAAVAELHRRRLSHPDPHVGEHAGDELAVLLTLTGFSAAGLLDQALALSRLPATTAALRAGRIDRGRAAVIGYETALLDDRLAAAVEQLVIEDAPAQTTARLRARLRRAVLAADPAAARRRQERASQDARVELHAEQAGTATLAGRDLPPVAALAADARIDAQARALKAAGVTATLAQLRAAVFLSLLTSQPPVSFLPPPASASPGTPSSDDHAAGPDDHTADGADPSATPAGTGSLAEPARPAGPDSPAGPDGGLVARGPIHPTIPRESVHPMIPRGSVHPMIPRGSVHLTVPLTTWLGLSDSPGEVSGYGLTDAGSCRDLAERIASTRGSRWCLTVTDPAGQAIAHACTRRPPPAGWHEPSGKTGWLEQLKLTRIEAVTCSHAREVPGYRIPDSLHHIVKTRQRTCAAPGCNRPAHRCDDDHTQPHDQGGRSCECNLAPLCRKHHRAKQTQGWHLEQPSPGVLVWTLPHGRRYVVTSGTYPL
jgi:hypothetical protein